MSGSAKMQLILELKNKLFNTKLMETQKKFTAASSKMRGGIDKLKNAHVKSFNAMKDQFPTLGRGLDLITNKYVLMAAAAAGIGMLFYQATNKAIAFNHEFLQIKQLNLDKPKEQMEQYKDIIRDSAFTVGADLNKTTKAFYDIQSATGFFGDDAKRVFEEVGKYSVATGADLNDSINSVTKAMGAFNLSSKDTKMLLESNAKAVQMGITTFDELAKVQTQFGGTAGNIGQSVDTANKLFAVFTKIGGTTAEASTLTKTFFQGIAQRGKEIEKVLNVKVFDTDGNFRQADQMLLEIGDKFKNMSQKQVANLIGQIGGPEGLSAMLFKMKGGAQGVIDTFNGFDASSFDLNKAFENAKGDVSIMSDMVKNRFGVIMESLGQRILPVVFYALDKINNLLTFYKEHANTINIVVGAALGAVVAFKAVTTAVTLWKNKQIILNTVLTANPIGIIIMAIAALVAAIIWVKDHVQGWGEQWQSVTDFMKGKWDTFKLGLEVSWGIIAHGFQNMIEGIVLAWKWGMNLIGQLSDKQYAKDKAAIARDKEIRINAIKNNAIEMVKANKKANDALQWKLSLKKKEDANEEALTSEGLMPSDVGGLGGSSTGGSASEDVTKVVGAGQQVRNITVNIDALNKGGINTTNTTLASMSTEEIERWFNESMLRTIRNLELSM